MFTSVFHMIALALSVASFADGSQSFVTYGLSAADVVAVRNVADKCASSGKCFDRRLGELATGARKEYKAFLGAASPEIVDACVRACPEDAASPDTAGYLKNLQCVDSELERLASMPQAPQLAADLKKTRGALSRYLRQLGKVMFLNRRYCKAVPTACPDRLLGPNDLKLAAGEPRPEYVPAKLAGQSSAKIPVAKKGEENDSGILASCIEGEAARHNRVDSGPVCDALWGAELGAFAPKLLDVYRVSSVDLYLESLRAKAISEFAGAHRRYAGGPVKPLPKECESYAAALEAPDAPEDESLIDDDTYLAQLRLAAALTQELVDDARAQAKLIESQPRKVGSKGEREDNPVRIAAEKRLKELNDKIMANLGSYPLLTAGHPPASEPHQALPAVQALAESSKDNPEEVRRYIRKELQPKLAADLRASLAKFCKQDPTEVGWTELARLSALTTPVLKMYKARGLDFTGLQKCLAKKLAERQRGKAAASMLLGAGCVLTGVGAAAAGCGVALAGEAGWKYLDAQQKLWAIGACRAAGGAVCTAADLEAARKGEVSAKKSLIASLIFASAGVYAAGAKWRAGAAERAERAALAKEVEAVYDARKIAQAEYEAASKAIPFTDSPVSGATLAQQKTLADATKKLLEAEGFTVEIQPILKDGVTKSYFVRIKPGTPIPSDWRARVATNLDAQTGTQLGFDTGIAGTTVGGYQSNGKRIALAWSDLHGSVASPTALHEFKHHSLYRGLKLSEAGAPSRASPRVQIEPGSRAPAFDAGVGLEPIYGRSHAVEEAACYAYEGLTNVSTARRLAASTKRADRTYALRLAEDAKWRAQASSDFIRVDRELYEAALQPTSGLRVVPSTNPGELAAILDDGTRFFFSRSQLLADVKNLPSGAADVELVRQFFRNERARLKAIQERADRVQVAAHDLIDSLKKAK